MYYILPKMTHKISPEDFSDFSVKTLLASSSEDSKKLFLISEFKKSSFQSKFLLKTTTEESIFESFDEAIKLYNTL